MHIPTLRLAPLLLACASCGSTNNGNSYCDCPASYDTVAVSPSETA
jgi:hypothetical protein